MSTESSLASKSLSGVKQGDNLDLILFLFAIQAALEHMSTYWLVQTPPLEWCPPAPDPKGTLNAQKSLKLLDFIRSLYADDASFVFMSHNDIRETTRQSTSRSKSRISQRSTGSITRHPRQSPTAPKTHSESDSTACTPSKILKSRISLRPPKTQQPRRDRRAALPSRTQLAPTNGRHIIPHLRTNQFDQIGSQN